MRVAEAFFQPQDFLAHYGEAKMPRFDGACMDGADGDLMHAVAFHGDEWIGLGDYRILLAAIDIPPQRKECLRPAAVTQPAARVRFVC